MKCSKCDSAIPADDECLNRLWCVACRDRLDKKTQKITEDIDAEIAKLQWQKLPLLGFLCLAASLYGAKFGVKGALFFTGVGVAGNVAWILFERWVLRKKRSKKKK